jgi:CRISPR-associated protein Cmr2
MTEPDDLLWQTKLAARLHDPVEKALILMRTVEGHEGGTSQTLRERLGLTQLPEPVRKSVQRADHWASAADRAAFPNRNADGRYPAWQQVRFDECPVIIHPLTGTEFALDKLTDVEPEAAKALALAHFDGLIHDGDLRKTALAFWRFGPEIDAPQIQSLWALLPADTRVPDHTIFDHLDLTAALAVCFALDPQDGPALLAVSLGPVQDFIAAARSTSDLWAGSHLLSRLAWEAMRVVCDELGPEAILFPRLRGVPLVDLWLRENCGLRAALFAACEWPTRGTDANPLFAAALPNRFTVLVPGNRARALAERITVQARAWMLEQGEAAYRLLLKTAEIADGPGLAGYRQLRDQLAGFPEVHWAAVPWSLVETRDDKVDASSTRLAEAMQPFFRQQPPGYLGSAAWSLLSGGIALEEGWFWQPNPGVLYPALHELLERVLAAAKSVRPFAQTEQAGWRDSLSGEAEWLTTDRDQLSLPPGQRSDTLWSRVAEKRPTWAKPGEHLSALNAIKRLWPTLFIDQLKEWLRLDVSRFVVSTHTMALATSLSRAVMGNWELPPRLADAVRQSRAERVALPRKLALDLAQHPDCEILTRLPGWLEAMTEPENESDARKADALLKEYLGDKPEAYYGLLLMDGDRMGAWLSAEHDLTLPHAESFHPQIRGGLRKLQHDQSFARYAAELRAPSPSRHMAISEALSHFALTLAPEVVEGQHHGRVLYAGGDDLMAMLPVIDLLPAMATLRAAYSGIDPAATGLSAVVEGFARQGNGFVRFRDRLMRMMGEQATASCGAVVAHHQAPLAAVLRELRAAEKRAKQEGGRDAFSLSIVKRSGGALRLTAKWGEPVRLLIKLRAFLADPGVSRRAVYNSTVWMRGLPEPDGDGVMVGAMLAWQLARQTASKTTRDHYDLPGLATALVAQAMQHAPEGGCLAWLENFLSVAEFLARETRAPAPAHAAPAQEAAG